MVDAVGDFLPDDGIEPVRSLRVPRQPLPLLWARGLAEARGEWLLIMETSCTPAPGWLTAVRQRLAGAPSVFGGAVEMADGHSMVDWSAYFCEYAQFMDPLPMSGRIGELPGNNICFHRDLMQIGKWFLAPGFWKTFWCNELMKNGVVLQAEPGMIVRFEKRYRFFPFLRRRFHHGRCYAGMRNLHLPGWKRMLYAGGSLFLPVLMLARMLQKFIPKRRLLMCYLAVLPYSILAVLAWAAGEAAGYCFGPGESCERI